MITAFLQHLETGRANTVTSRNARLAAIRSLFRYAALRAPEHAAVISRVLAIPPKRCDRAIVCYLDAGQIDALLAAPGQASWLARRDHALLLVAVQTGLRVSELAGLTTGDVHLGPGPHVRCHGKGRKDRATPLTRQTITVLRAWLAERRGRPGDPLFPTRAGRRLSRDALERLVARHAAAAATRCPSLAGKNVTPHTLRLAIPWKCGHFPLADSCSFASLSEYRTPVHLWFPGARLCAGYAGHRTRRVPGGAGWRLPMFPA